MGEAALFVAGFLLGAFWGGIYHTRIEPVAAWMRREKAVLEADLNNWKNEAVNARDELAEMRKKVEERMRASAQRANSDLKKL